MNGIIKYKPNHIEQKLFSIRQVTVTTAMAGLLAGSVLIGINYKRKGLKNKYYICLTIGVFGIVILSAFSLLSSRT